MTDDLLLQHQLLKDVSRLPQCGQVQALLDRTHDLPKNQRERIRNIVLTSLTVSNERAEVNETNTFLGGVWSPWLIVISFVSFLAIYLLVIIGSIFFENFAISKLQDTTLDIITSFLLSFAIGAMGGTASAKGQLFTLNDKPWEVAITGGIAVFFISLFVFVNFISLVSG